MENLNLLSDFLQRVTADVRLNAVHISLYTVLCHSWIANGCKNPFSISRSRLMHLARIRSRATYHKCIQALVRGGYIRYRPSYHPVHGTAVSLLSGKLATE